MKKLFFFMILMVLPLVVSAYDCQVDGIYYNLNSEEKTAEVTSGDTKYSDSVTIPEKFTYDGVDYSVTSIGENAFNECRITSVTIPNSVTTIGTNAFFRCSSLTSVHITDLAAWCKITFDYSHGCISNPLYYAQHLYLNGEEIKDLVIPSSVTSIKDEAFDGCSGLTSVTIPNSVTTIGSVAFRYCTGLTSVTIPNSVTSIGENAFSECYSLTSVTFPNSVTSIGALAFSRCWGLTSVHITDLAAWCKIVFSSSDTNPLSYAHHLYLNGEEVKDLVIPNSVITIGDYCFESFTSLTSVTIPNSVTNIGSCAFSYCTGLSSVTIPNSVTNIGYATFWGCSGLTSVTIPNSVTNIESGAFLDCAKLEEVYCYAEKVPATYSIVFEHSNYRNATLYVPASALEDYRTTKPWSEFGTILPLPDETGIENVAKQKAERTYRYTPDGKRVETPKKGLNIIRMSDGTVKKVVVK